MVVGYSSDEKALKKFTRLMIKHHNFVGSYLEQRYVPQLGCFKKIIKVSRKEEIFIENLSIIKRRLEQFYENSKWIGITSTETLESPAGFNLWVDIEEDIFGTYKFSVRDVSFSKDQVSLKVAMIDSFEETRNSRESSRNNSRSASFENSRSLIEECEKPIMTWNNFKESAVFIFLLILTIVTLGVQVIKYILDYILKLLEVSTPIVIAFFNTFSKMFGYLCFLIAYLCKGGEKQYNGYNHIMQMQHYQPIQYPYNRYKALPYKHKNSVVITELDE